MRRAWPLLAVLAILLPACAAPTPPPVARAKGPSLPAGSLPVPLVRQAATYSCGAAALEAILQYWQVYDGGETRLWKELDTTPEDGTSPESIARGAEAHGLRAEIREGLAEDDLAAALRSGDTVILDLQAWRESDEPPLRYADDWDDGHYVVLVGMDAENLYAMDPSSTAGYGYLPRRELLERWHDVETRGGRNRRFVHAGIVIRGKTPLRSIPGPLVRIE